MSCFRNVVAQRMAVVAAFLLSAATALDAQTGVLAGRVTDVSSGGPLKGATVRVMGSDATTRLTGAITHADGTYSVQGLAPGTYRVTISFLSYAPYEANDVKIGPGERVTLDAALQQTTLGLDEVVISASRRPEKITSAPASVSVVDARRVEERPALTAVDHVKSVPGLDIVQSGLTQSNVVARGFNNAFSGSMMMLTDNRIASVPSLRVNAHNFVPLVSEDIQQIEVIRGPGSALYGPNTANGVLHIITRSPFASAGTWVSLAAGERSLFQGMARHAGTIGDRLGYKISAQYMRGEDWGFTDSAEVYARTQFLADPANAGVNPDTLKIGLRDSSIERAGGELRLDYTPLDDLSMILAIGANRAIRNPDITGVGGAQARDWQYTYCQGRVLYKDLFVQAFLNQSDAGETYLLRTGQPIIDRSTLFVAQVQHSLTFEGLGRLAYGLDYLLTTPVTDSTITGSNEGDDDITEIGGYLQAEATLVPDALDLVLAGRVDHHSRLEDPIFSPRAALVWTPLRNQTFRLTYNTAYSAPSTNDLFLDIIVEKTPIFNVRATGVPEGGFTFRRDENGLPLVRGYFTPAPAGYVPRQEMVNSAWTVLQGLVRETGLGTIDDVAPPSADLLELRTLDATTGGFVPGGTVSDRPPIRPTINSTIELGYKGILGERFGLSVDVYQSRYHDFVGPLEAITPNLFFRKDELRDYLADALRRLNPDDTATANLFAAILADTASKVPLGVISPAESVADPTAVLFSNRNYGDITIYGVDLGWQLGVIEGITLNGTLSWVSDNFFSDLEGVSDLSLNAPKFKYTIAGEYRNNEIGVNGEIRFRHVDGFPVNSGVYVGDVPGYSVVDLNVGYRLPFAEGLNLAISAQNLLTFVEGESESPFSQRHAEFVGVPAIGRLVLARLTYEFR